MPVCDFLNFIQSKSPFIFFLCFHFGKTFLELKESFLGFSVLYGTISLYDFSTSLRLLMFSVKEKEFSSFGSFSVFLYLGVIQKRPEQILKLLPFSSLESLGRRLELFPSCSKTIADRMDIKLNGINLTTSADNPG